MRMIRFNGAGSIKSEACTDTSPSWCAECLNQPLAVGYSPRPQTFIDADGTDDGVARIRVVDYLSEARYSAGREGATTMQCLNY